MQRSLRGLSICSGVGMLDYAAEQAGVEVIGQVEYDDKCQVILSQRYPDIPKCKDLRTFNGDEFGVYDLLFGGIPCQPWSIAGRKRGHDDARDLWPDTLRIIRRTNPSWVLIENVARFARTALDRVWTDLEAEGYEVGAVVLPACSFGAPHKRERCFTLAHSNHGHVGQAEQVRAGRDTTLLRGEALAHSGSEGLQGCELAAGVREKSLRHPSGRVPRPTWAGLLESWLGRAANGIAARLDREAWPSRPGEAQAEWEAPRVVSERVPNHASRLKQLGNGVVWQQAYPFFALIVAIEEMMYGDCLEAA